MNRFTARLMKHRPTLYSYLVIGKKVDFKANITTHLVANITGQHVGTQKNGK